MVRNYQRDSLVGVLCPWSESILPLNERGTVDLLLDKGWLIATANKVYL